MKYIKVLIMGFWINGIVALFKSIMNSWIIVTITLILITFLCSYDKTATLTWWVIGISALYYAIMAIILIIISIIKIIKTEDEDTKIFLVRKIGGYIFDFSLCILGLLQVFRYIRHALRVSSSASSAVSLLDDVSALISKFFKK